MQLAFVIKNYIPYSFKIVLLHQKYGKIVAIFSKNDQAALLTSGSLIWCTVEKKNTAFMITHVEIESEIAIHNLLFIHDIMRLCLHRLPSKICVPEFFDFLLYVRGHMNKFCNKAEKIVMLRLFLMLDLLDQDPHLYQIAILDPMKNVDCEDIILEKHVASGWNNFYKIKDLT